MPVIDYDNLPQEEQGSPTWSKDGAGMTGRRSWLIKWEDCDKGVVPDWAPIPKITRFAPGSQMFCTSISVEPRMSVDSTGKTYALGVLTADYSTGASVDAWPHRSWEPYTDILQIGGGRHWASDGKPVSQSQTIRISMERFTYSRTFDWNSLILPSIHECVGKINNGYFEGYPEETLLLESPRIVQEIQPDTGIVLAIIEYQFLYNSMGWNNSWRSDTGDIDTMLPKMYRRANFRDLPW